MSATVAAALKKIAVAVLTDKKLRRTVLGIVLGVIIIIIMPVAAVISLFNGDIEIDTDRLQALVVENLSAEEKAKLQAVEDTMYAIEDEMKAAGFTAEKAKEDIRRSEHRLRHKRQAQHQTQQHGQHTVGHASFMVHVISSSSGFSLSLTHTRKKE